MEKWYGLKNDKIVEIESTIVWFRNNDEKLINYLVEAWFVAGKDKPRNIGTDESDKVPNWLDRCYAINKDKNLPPDILPLLVKELQPFSISLR